MEKMAVDWAATGNAVVRFRVFRADPNDANKTLLVDSTHPEDAAQLGQTVARQFEPLPIRIGRKFAVRAWETKLKTMTHVGETVRFQADPTESAEYLQLAAVLRDAAEDKAGMHDHRDGHDGHGHSHDAHGHDEHEHGHSHEKARAIDSDDEEEQALRTRKPARSCGCAANATDRMARDSDLMELAGSSLVFELELVKAERHGEFERDLWEYDAEEHPAESKRLKADGNKLFQAGELRSARRLYRRAVAHLELLHGSSYWLDLSPSQQAELRELEISCRLNDAACSVKLHRPEPAIRQCSEVLQLSPQHVKALFRRAQAYAMMDRTVDQAEADLLKCQSIVEHAAAPDQSVLTDIQRELRTVRDRLQKLDRQQRQIYARMFA